jgi:hypothetical protein
MPASWYCHNRLRKRVVLGQIVSNLSRKVVSTCPALGASSVTLIYIIIIAALRVFIRRSENGRV